MRSDSSPFWPFPPDHAARPARPDRGSGSGYFDKRSPPTDLPQLEVGGQTLVDVNLAYELPLDTGKTSVYLNVMNLFNELPPPFTGLGQNYDPIGCFYRVGVKLDL
jgi:iron complex outermembrane recepter protein